MVDIVWLRLNLAKINYWRRFIEVKEYFDIANGLVDVISDPLSSLQPIRGFKSAE